MFGGVSDVRTVRPGDWPGYGTPGSTRRTGEIVPSYTMLTINADHHPLMSRMHRPDPRLPPDQQDKRSVVSIEVQDVDRGCTDRRRKQQGWCASRRLMSWMRPRRLSNGQRSLAMRIERIVSGGQTGADRAALDWAIAHGVPHGGWASIRPHGRGWSHSGKLPTDEAAARRIPSANAGQRPRLRRDADRVDRTSAVGRQPFDDTVRRGPAETVSARQCGRALGTAPRRVARQQRISASSMLPVPAPPANPVWRLSPIASWMRFGAFLREVARHQTR